MDVGVPELLIILVVVLVIFGGAKLPQLARSLGQAQHEFKKGASGHHDDGAAAEPAPAADQPAIAGPEAPPFETKRADPSAN
jgi:sec-independent protein translocase protein TatA